MEETKKSFSSDLFESKDDSSSVFGQIFSTPAKVVKRESMAIIDSRSCKNRVSDKTKVREEVHSQRTESKGKDSYNSGEKHQPFHYSSSIYYGGQDVYTLPESIPNTVFTTFNKDGGEDDSDGATRGNWWKGSLYY